MDIISKKLASGRFYAYHGGQFWFWDEARNIWKESHLMAKKYDLNHEFDKLLSPEDFLSDPSQFEALEDYQVDYLMKNALQDAQPCQTVPIEPVEEPEVPGTQTAQEKPLTTVPDAIRPAFDYSGLTDQTVEDLHLAEEEYLHGKKLAARGLVSMGEGIAIAHDALVANCDRHKNQHSEDTFRAWCLSMGITKDTAYRLLQVSALMDGSSPAQQKVLKELSPSLLYAVAKPSAPEGLVEQVKNGDITTHKEYQELLAQLKAEKERSAAAEAERDKLLGAQNRAAWAESHIQDVEAQRQKAEAERDRAEQRAKTAEEALKKQPIAAVIDEEEIDRRAAEKAWGLADARNAELAKDNANLKKQVAALRSRINDDAQADFEQANYCASLMQAAWDNSKASYSRLAGEDLESTFQTICGTLNSIMEEASLLCRQPSDHDGGDRDE